MLRLIFVILHIFKLIIFAYGDKRPIVQILSHRNLNCTTNENNFNELDCKCAHNNVSWDSWKVVFLYQILSKLIS